MTLTLTSANTAYFAAPRLTQPANIPQSFKRIGIVNNSGQTIFVGGSSAIIGGPAGSGGMPIATGERVFIATAQPLYISCATAGMGVDYEYFA
jgi:hypothetical protein